MHTMLPLALGVGAHLAIFIQGEWHLQAPALFIAHATAFSALFVLGISQPLTLWLLYLTGLFLSMGCYRLLFHRLRAFPGPRMAALSKLWHVLQCLDSRNHLVLQRLHAQYGPFVRTGMSPLSLRLSSSALQGLTSSVSRAERNHHLPSGGTSCVRWPGQ